MTADESRDAQRPNTPDPTPTPRRGDIAASGARQRPTRCSCGGRMEYGYCSNTACARHYPEPPYDEDRLAHERAHARGRIS